MSRVKKNRKSGSTAKPRSGESKPKAAKSDPTQYSKKRGKGLVPGSRQNELLLGAQSTGGRNKNKDPRHGSKRKISLIAPDDKPEVKLQQAELKVETISLTPELELEQLEQDPRLMELLDKLDDEQTISTAEQRWLDKKMDRHQHLLKHLGLLEDDELDQGDLGSYLDE